MNRRGVPLFRTFSTVLVHANEAGDACVQNDKKGGSAEPKEPPLDPPLMKIANCDVGSKSKSSLQLLSLPGVLVSQHRFTFSRLSRIQAISCLNDQGCG